MTRHVGQPPIEESYLLRTKAVDHAVDDFELTEYSNLLLMDS